jgi:ubiquinone/menaquinone biosynthesis C-methylase UbiE
MIEEAKKSYKDKDFLVLDMISIDKIEDRKFDFIFFIASFHHLQTIEERIEVLQKAKDLLKKD